MRHALSGLLLTAPLFACGACGDASMAPAGSTPTLPPAQNTSMAGTSSTTPMTNTPTAPTTGTPTTPQPMTTPDPMMPTTTTPNPTMPTTTTPDPMMPAPTTPAPTTPAPTAPTPIPEGSVCATNLVVGMGGAGMMDDLERPAAQLQLFPNPSQADGRTGTWSWYPEAAAVEIAAADTGQALSFTGTGLAAWAGTTLAFLGTNGANSCYDASAYTGISFRIRGSVAAADLPNQVIVSVITAETQPTTLGGDLTGMGGHFNRIVPITETWQDVTLAWNTFGPPTWGDTTTLTAVAQSKLQAIDWGVSNTATSFEVWIDDVQLY